MIKFENLDDALNRLVRNIENLPRDYVLFGAEQAELIFKDRIFTFKGASDINGAKLPRYNPAYAKKKGKRSSTWDLIAEGDLMGSIRPHTVTAKKEAQLMFDDTEQVEKANKIEARTGQTIFQITAKERKEIINRITREMMRDIKKIIEKSFK